MKVFFIFNIKDEFKYLYKDNSSTLYKILKQIYNLDNNDMKYGKTVFFQLINPINKKEIDYRLFLKLHQEIPYSKKGEIHYFNNLYKDEVSRLIVKRIYIKIETDTTNSSFFNVISEYKNNLFVCDFKNSNFFWLDNAKSLV